MEVRRLADEPIITAGSHPSIGDNINGPSLIRVPSWVSQPLGRYYLYFAHHKGDHIRLAFSDELAGPWTVHPGGVLALDESRFLTERPPATEAEIASFESIYADMFGDYVPPGGLLADATTPHIASPDVRVNDSYRTLTMYFHGLESLGMQVTRHATSLDGLHFDVDPPTIDGTYLRGFCHYETEYALTMPGTVLRRTGRPTEFDQGPAILPRTARHSAVQVVGDELRIYWTRVGDTPERILLSTVDLAPSWTDWTASESVEVLRPQLAWEGAGEPLVPSRRSAAPGPVNQLRDPAVYVEEERTYLVYAVAGESGLAIAELAGGS